MENFTIEKMEIKRFNALLVRTIASALLLGVLIWETFCLDTSSKGFIGGIWYIFVFAVLLLTAGFYAAIQMGLLVYCFGDFFNLSVRMGALIIVTVTVLISEIRRLLLYNPYKDGK